MEDKWGQYYQNKAADNINALLKKIDSQSFPEGIQYISMFDELNADSNGYDFSRALNGIKKLLALMAVNPASFRCPGDIPLEFRDPQSDNLTTVRLVSKHRNAFQIANLLVHYNNHRNSLLLGTNYKCLPSSEDEKMAGSSSDIKKLGNKPSSLCVPN